MTPIDFFRNAVQNGNHASRFATKTPATMPIVAFLDSNGGVDFRDGTGLWCIQMPPNRALHRSVQKGARWVNVLSGIISVALGMTMLSAARVLFGAFVTVQEDSSLLVNSYAILAPGEASTLPVGQVQYDGLLVPVIHTTPGVPMQEEGRMQRDGLSAPTWYAKKRSTQTAVQRSGISISTGQEDGSIRKASFDWSDENISAACRDIPDTRSSPLSHLSEVLQIEGEVDEFGKMSRFPRPVSVVRKLLADGLIPTSQGQERRPLYAVNFGARDGKGDAGNTDPAYPLFAELGFHGMAVEASPVFFRQLQAAMSKFPVLSMKSFITVENAVSLIKKARLPAVDVFKIDIDSFDCDVMPKVLAEYKPSVVIAEYNVYFPPPIKMKLIPSTSGYDSEKRSNVYECSIQYLDDDVMRPLGYVLLQLDWQNVIYCRADIAVALGMPHGVDVQAAYHKGYTTQPQRSTLYPWGDWEDFYGGKPRKYGLNHLLDVPRHEQVLISADRLIILCTSAQFLDQCIRMQALTCSHTQRMASALKWARLSVHRQKVCLLLSAVSGRRSEAAPEIDVLGIATRACLTIMSSSYLC